MWNMYPCHRGTAFWARGRHTSKGKRFIIMAEPKEATFWESVIEILRDWLSLWQAKNTSTQRKQVSYSNGRAHGGDGAWVPFAEVPGAIPHPPVLEVW